MSFAREGYLPAAIPAFAGVVVGAAWSWSFGAPLVVLGILVLLFFRDPERIALGDELSFLSPADGRVVSVVADCGGHELAPEARQRVAIFMSPLDVHINRLPLAGMIETIRHRKGQFRAAYTDDASEVNESNTVVVRLATEGPKSIDRESALRAPRMVVVQIAGWLARRIVCHSREGDILERGQRFGLIMFGSRVDVYLPETVSVAVTPGQRVTAGRTVIAEIDPESLASSDDDSGSERRQASWASRASRAS